LAATFLSWLGVLTLSNLAVLAINPKTQSNHAYSGHSFACIPDLCRVLAISLASRAPP
jgi:hypothetical protein